MFSKVAAADNLNRLIQIVVDQLNQGWVVAGGIAFDE
jgi:hypothetical protein